MRVCAHRCQRSGLRSRFSLCTLLRWDLSCFSCLEQLLIAYNRPMIPHLCLPASLRSVAVASVSHHIWLFVGLGAPTQVIRFMGQGLSLLNHFIRPMQMTLTLSQLWDPGLWKMRSARATSLPMSYRAPPAPTHRRVSDSTLFPETRAMVIEATSLVFAKWGWREVLGSRHHPVSFLIIQNAGDRLFYLQGPWLVVVSLYCCIFNLFAFVQIGPLTNLNLFCSLSITWGSQTFRLYIIKGNFPLYRVSIFHFHPEPLEAYLVHLLIWILPVQCQGI